MNSRYHLHYEMTDGRVRTRSLDLHVVDHCNLRCWSCYSLSPRLSAFAITPEEIQRDLTLVEQVVSPHYVDITGGEPLLHPDIVGILKAVRTVRLRAIITVTTNGLLLDKMPEEFWMQIDALTISIYPKPLLPNHIRLLAYQKAEKYNFVLDMKKNPTFQTMGRQEPSADERRNRAVFSSCSWRQSNHMIRDGYFYTCFRPAHFQTYYGKRIDFTGDGVRLHDGPELSEQIHRYLERSIPLKSCALCMGSQGSLKPHRLVSI